MIGKTESERENRIRRVGGAARRKYRAPGDIKVVHAVDFTIRIDDSSLRVAAHARRPHVVIADPDVVDEVVVRRLKACSTELSPAGGFAEERGERLHGVELLIADALVELRPR